MSVVRLSVPNYVAPKQTICSSGALGVISALPATRMAIITPRRTLENPTLNRVLSKQKRIQIKVFHPSWVGEPTTDNIQNTLEQISSYNPDYITAIGGGRVLDGAKLVWAFFEHPHFNRDRLSILFSLPPLGRRSRFCCVPTTAGTGSEASSSAIILDPHTMKKIPVVTHDFLPDIAVLDAELLTSLPEKWICLTGMDALAHAIEGYASRQKNSLAKSLVISSVSSLLDSLNNLKNTPYNINYLEQAMIGAHWAGIIQNNLLVGPAHAIANQLGGVPHGLSTGLLLPHVIQLQAKKSKVLEQSYCDLAMKVGFDSLNKFVDHLFSLPQEYNIKPKLSKWPGVQSSVGDIGELAQKDFLSRVFPVEMTIRDLNNLFEKVW